MQIGVPLYIKGYQYLLNSYFGFSIPKSKIYG